MDCKIKAVHPKGNEHWLFIGKTDTEAEAPILWSSDTKSGLIGKDPDAGKDRGQENGLTGWDGWIPMVMTLSKLWERAKDREAWNAAAHAVTEAGHHLETEKQQQILQMNTQGSETKQ